MTAADQGTDSLLIELTRGEGIGIQVKDGIYGVPLRGVMVRLRRCEHRGLYRVGRARHEGKGEVSSLSRAATASWWTRTGTRRPSERHLRPVADSAVTHAGRHDRDHAGDKSLVTGTLKGTLKTSRPALLSRSST